MRKKFVGRIERYPVECAFQISEEAILWQELPLKTV